MIPADLPAQAIDVNNPSWAEKACDELKNYGCARLRLTTPEVSSVGKLYSAADALFNDRNERRLLEVPDEEFDDLDYRSGYVYSRRREFFELHLGCRSASALDHKCTGSVGKVFLENMWAVIDICQKRCQEALQEIAMSQGSTALLQLLKDEDRGQFEQRKVLKDCMRVYRYKESHDRPEHDTAFHFDIGLLTLIPRGSRPALLVKPPNAIYIEEFMGEDEALLMGGMTLARLTGIRALEHGVCTHSKIRFSAPFFQRVAPSCMLPASRGHPAEKVSTWNSRVCDAENEELRSDGSIVLRERSRGRDRRRRDEYQVRGDGRQSGASQDLKKDDWH